MRILLSSAGTTMGWITLRERTKAGIVWIDRLVAECTIETFRWGRLEGLRPHLMRIAIFGAVCHGKGTTLDRGKGCNG